jgi:serine/threonine protein phosphatase 1
VRVYAIGDVHGRSDLLDQLLDAIGQDNAARPPSDTRLIFLGDLIDRGPDSAGVISRALSLKHGALRARFVLGNHEEVFLNALEGRPGAMRLLHQIGGRETLVSYGISEEEYRTATFEELTALAQVHVPQSHRAFLAEMDSHITLGSYLFVHAGIRPDVPLAQQAPSDMRWIREDFLRHRHPHSYVVVHGHSVVAGVEMHHNRIGIDTGAWSSGILTAIGLESSRRWIIDTANGLL